MGMGWLQVTGSWRQWLFPRISHWTLTGLSSWGCAFLFSFHYLTQFPFQCISLRIVFLFYLLKLFASFYPFLKTTLNFACALFSDFIEPIESRAWIISKEMSQGERGLRLLTLKENGRNYWDSITPVWLRKRLSSCNLELSLYIKTNFMLIFCEFFCL